MKDYNPKVVCAHLSAYGRSGPRSNWPGFDYLMQAEAGFFSLTGEPDAPPARFGLSVVDQMTGLALAYALTAGIIGARKTGIGQDMDVSLFDIAMANTAYPAIWYLNEGHVQERVERSAHPVLCPCQLYKTEDNWIYLMCNKEKFWPVLCKVLGQDKWIEDKRFENFSGRDKHRGLIQEMLDDVLSTKKTKTWLESFAGKVPAAPVNNLKEALDSPFMQQSSRIQELELDGYGKYRMLNSPIKCGEEETPARPAPKMGANTAELLYSLGYDDEEISDLKKRSIV